MDPKRRAFLTNLVPGAMLVGAGLMSASAILAHPAQVFSVQQSQTQHPVPPINPSHPPVIPATPASPSKAQLRQNERDIRKDVDQLFSLAQELKSMSGKSDASEELSVGLIEKTEEIEKLARKIRDLARS